MHVEEGEGCVGGGYEGVGGCGFGCEGVGGEETAVGDGGLVGFDGGNGIWGGVRECFVEECC